MLDGGTDRVRSWSSDRPSHFQSRVSRWYSRNARSIARSSPKRSGKLRSIVMCCIVAVRPAGAPTAGRSGPARSVRVPAPTFLAFNLHAVIHDPELYTVGPDEVVVTFRTDESTEVETT